MQLNFLERALDGRTQAWRYLIVSVIGFFGGQFIGAVPLAVLIALRSMGGEIPDLSTSNLLDGTALGVSRNMMLCLNLLPFVVTLALIIFLIRWMHGRTWTETVNGTRRIRWNRIAAGATVWGSLTVIALTLDYFIDPANYVFQFDVAKFIPLVLLSLCLIPLQTTCEELLFRGYLTQGVAGWTRNRWCAVIIPGVLFGLMHSLNPEVHAHGFWWMMPNYILLGLFFGLVSVLDDGIELALGMHAANNLLACLLVTHSSSSLQTDALFRVLSIDPAGGLIESALMIAVALAAFSAKYRWNFNLLQRKVKRVETFPA
jgi:membrane protease YdiL (CAAX protease family)